MMSSGLEFGKQGRHCHVDCVVFGLYLGICVLRRCELRTCTRTLTATFSSKMLQRVGESGKFFKSCAICRIDCQVDPVKKLLEMLCQRSRICCLYLRRNICQEGPWIPLMTLLDLLDCLCFIDPSVVLYCVVCLTSLFPFLQEGS